jgi:hypothetical protein
VTHTYVSTGQVSTLFDALFLLPSPEQVAFCVCMCAPKFVMNAGKVQCDVSSVRAGEEGGARAVRRGFVVVV